MAAEAAEAPPRWWPVATMLALIRTVNAAGHLAHAQPAAAARALRPSWYCVCDAWTACTAYYNVGYRQYCPRCGTYRAC